MSAIYAPEIIPPLVRRHVEDAAFYWSQHDASSYSPILDLSGLMRFSDLLAAHLDGVEAAGSGGWVPALAALERWKQPGEAFVCAYSVLSRDDAVQIDALLQHVSAHPDVLLRGVISALLWIPRERATIIIKRWIQPDGDPLKQVTALRAAALCDHHAGDAPVIDASVLTLLLSNTNAHVRAAACRVATVVVCNANNAPLLDALHLCLEDSETAVRAEAAICLGRFKIADKGSDEQQIAIAEVLWQCVVTQVNALNAASGWYRKQALRRLLKWVQHLAMQIPVGHSQLGALLAYMPARVSLHFIAYHGDPVHLPYVLEQMSDEANARYAGWVWRTLTGIDMQGERLCLPEPEQPDLGISEARLDADLGLPLPDAERIRVYPLPPLKNGQRYLLGHTLSPAYALHLMSDTKQAWRSVASNYLQSLDPRTRSAMGGEARRQMDLNRRLGDLHTTEEAIA